jgi:hypothetical protein
MFIGFRTIQSVRTRGIGAQKKGVRVKEENPQKEEKKSFPNFFCFFRKNLRIFAAG